MARIAKKISAALVAAFVVAMTIGCDSEPTTDTAHVQGKVTLSGAAIPANAQAAITFMPTGVGQANPAGGKIVNGAYDVTGVPKGKVTVTFMIMQPGAVKSFDGVARPQAEMKSLVPENRTNGIEKQIDGDMTDLNFDL